MAVSGVSAVGNISSRYEVLSINGNPKSVKPVESVGSNSSQSSVQVNVAPKIEDEVAGEQKSRPLRQVVSSDYADIMKMQDMISSNSEGLIISSNDYGNSLMDIRDKMMAGINTKMPEVNVSGNDEPNARAVSVSMSDGPESSKLMSNIYSNTGSGSESEDMIKQLAGNQKTYNYKKMVSAYETAMLYAG